MPRQRPFRFGVVSASAPTREAWREKARTAEQLGYSTLLMLDHISVDFSPALALMAAADATETLRIGSSVFCNDYRHPALLAKEVATLDVLSGGRFEFGFGAGWQRSEYEAAGLVYDAAGSRISRFKESLAIIKDLFAEEGPVNFNGEYYHIHGLDGSPKPLQKPYPPLYIGGGGKRVLSIAAREADIVGIVPIARENVSWQDMSDGTAEATARKVTWIREAAGERFDHLELNTSVFAVVVTDHRLHVAEAMGQNFGITGQQVLGLTHCLVGNIDQICEDLLERREQFGISYISVLDTAMKAFAPVVERLAGK